MTYFSTYLGGRPRQAHQASRYKRFVRGDVGRAVRPERGTQISDLPQYGIMQRADDRIKRVAADTSERQGNVAILFSRMDGWGLHIESGLLDLYIGQRACEDIGQRTLDSSDVSEHGPALS